MNYDTPAKVPEYGMLRDEIFKELEQLMAAIEGLTVRLDVVMRPDSPPTDMKNPNGAIPVQSVSKMISDLQNMRFIITENVIKLNRIKDRLEV